MNVDWQRTGMLTVATEAASGRMAARGGRRGARPIPRRGGRCARRWPRRPTGPGCSPPTPAPSCTRRKLAFELARACSEAGVQIFEHTPALSVDRDRGGVRVNTRGGVITADQVVLATNVFPSLLRRNRLYTVPVYDYVLATEPLTDAQLDRIGWRSRQGIGDCCQPVPLLPAVRGQPDRVGRLRRGLPLRSARRRRCTRTVRRPTAGWPRTSSSRSRNSTTSGSPTGGPGRSTPTPDSARTGGWPAGAASPTSTASPASASAPPGSPPTSAWTCSSGHPTERTELEMVNRKPLPFPPEPIASIGIQATRWSLDRADHYGGRAQPLPADARPLRARFRFVEQAFDGFASRSPVLFRRIEHNTPRRAGYSVGFRTRAQEEGVN